jgi:NADH-quinone oxidoreductase subunit K
MGALTLNHFLVLGALLFAISVVGIFLNRRNVIVLLMAIELMLLAVNLNFVAFSHFLGDLAGQVFVFFILTVAAAESAIGLAILVVLFRNLATINVEVLDSLKGCRPCTSWCPWRRSSARWWRDSSAARSAAPARTGSRSWACWCRSSPRAGSSPTSCRATASTAASTHGSRAAACASRSAFSSTRSPP